MSELSDDTIRGWRDEAFGDHVVIREGQRIAQLCDALLEARTDAARRFAKLQDAVDEADALTTELFAARAERDRLRERLARIEEAARAIAGASSDYTKDLALAHLRSALSETERA